MHILLESTKNYRGILVITHNEITILEPHFKNITKKYFIIMHLQWSFEPPRNKNISLYMVPPSYCSIEKDIPYTVERLINKNFDYTSDIIHTNQKILKILDQYNIKHELLMKNERIFDFIYIGRCNENKKTLDVIDYFEHLSKKGFMTCIIILKQNDKCEYYKKFLQKYNNSKSNILLIDTHIMNIENDEFHGLIMEDIALFFRSSKIYVHSCEDEGSSRTIHEAICSGCYLICKENMKGGGLNELTDKNSTLYLHKNFYQKVEEAIEKSKKYECCDEDINKCSEKFTLVKFITIIHQKLNYKIPIDEFIQKCDITKIQLKFTAHYLKVPWYIKGNLTASLTEKNIKIFLDHIK